MCLGILRMGPFQSEVAALEKVAAAPLSFLVVRIRGRETAVELVVHFVPGVDVQSPRAEGIDISGNRKVEIVTEYEIHTRVARVKTSGLLLAESRHEHSGGALRLLRDESEGEGYGEVDTFDHGMGRTEDCLLRGFGDDFCRTEGEIVVRLIRIADGVLAVGDVDGPVRHHLDVPSVKDTLIVCGGHVGDAGLLRIEVVPHFLHLILVLALFHDGEAAPFSSLRILYALRKDFARGHVILHVSGGQLHVLVGDLDISVVVYHAFSVSEHLYDGILRAGESRLVQGTLAKE